MTRPSRTSSPHRLSPLVLLLLGVLAAGCSDAVVTEGTTGTGGGDATPVSAKKFYIDQVHPELVQSCAICHKSSADCTPKLMADDAETSYEILRQVEGMVTHPLNSNLIHHGAHTGPTLTLAQETIVVEWLSLEFPDPPAKRTQFDALKLLGQCMRFEDFEKSGVFEFAYQQTQYGPCGACHKTGEAGAWIGYNPEEMFSKNTQLPWIKRLVHPVYDESAEFIDFTASNRFIEKPEYANQCGSAHPSALIPAQLEQALVDYLALTMERYETGQCDPQTDDDTNDQDMEEAP